MTRRLPTSKGSVQSAVTRRWDLPRMRIVETIYPPLHRMRPHYHDLTKVSVLVAGAVEETANREAHLCVAGSVVVKPAGVVHADRFGPAGARILSFQPKAEFLQEETGWVDRMTRYRWRHHGPAADLVTRLAAELDEPRPALDDVAEECLIELADLAAAAGEGRIDPHPPRWLESARERIHAGFASQPGIRRLATEVGVHPVYFARAFRRYFRCTVHQYVRRLRILNAAELLTGSDLMLVDVALKAGFADQAHFCREFKRETKMTPQAYRLRDWADKR